MKRYAVVPVPSKLARDAAELHGAPSALDNLTEHLANADPVARCRTLRGARRRAAELNGLLIGLVGYAVFDQRIEQYVR